MAKRERAAPKEGGRSPGATRGRAASFSPRVGAAHREPARIGRLLARGAHDRRVDARAAGETWNGTWNETWNVMPTAPPQAQSPMAAALVVLVRVYQRLVSPVLVALFGPQCRFEPSCSRYAVACLETHGAWRGSLLSLVRLCKCHPFHRGGFDPPPPRRPLPTPTSTLEAPRQVRRPEPAPHPSAPPS